MNYLRANTYPYFGLDHLEEKRSIFLPLLIALGLVGMIFQQEFMVGSLNLMWGEPLLLTAIMANLFYSFKNRTLCKTYLDGPIAIYGVSLICSLFVAGFTERSLGIFRKELIAILLFYVIVWNLWDRQSRKIVAYGIIAAAFVTSIIAMVQYMAPKALSQLFAPTGTAGHMMARGIIGFIITGTPSLVMPVFAPFNHFNALGAFLAMTLPLMIVLSLKMKRWNIRVMTGITVFVLYMTFSRGAWAGFLVGLGLMGWFHFRNTGRKKLAVLFMVIVALIIITFLIILMFTSYSRTLHFMSARLPLWSFVYEESADQPVFGLGLAGVEKYLGSHAFNSSAHSDYVQIYGDRGIFGLMAYLQLLGFGLFAGYKSIRDRLKPEWIYLGATTGITAIMVHSFVDHPLNDLTFKILIFTLLALLTSVHKDPLKN